MRDECRHGVRDGMVLCFDCADERKRFPGIDEMYAKRMVDLRNEAKAVEVKEWKDLVSEHTQAFIEDNHGK